MGAVTAGFAAWHYRAGLARARTHARAAHRSAVRNPFSLTAAIRFGALFAAVLLVVKLAQRHAPEQGVYVVAALAGSVDVDAITLSMADASRGSDGFAQATAAIVIAVGRQHRSSSAAPCSRSAPGACARRSASPPRRCWRRACWR